MAYPDTYIRERVSKPSGSAFSAPYVNVYGSSYSGIRDRNNICDSEGKWRYRSAQVQGDHRSPTSYTHTSVRFRGIGTAFGSEDRLGESGPVDWFTSPITSGFVPPDWDGSMTDLLVSGRYGSGPLLPLVDSKAQNLADNMALSRLQEEKFSLGVALAELRETSSYLAGKLSRLSRGLIAIKRGDVRGVKRAWSIKKRGEPKSKTASRLWLEYNYAARPIMNDIHDLVNLHKEGLNADLFVSSKGKALKKVSIDSERYISNYGYYKMSGHVKIKHITKLYARVDDQNISLLQQFGLENPGVIAWELVPYSFCVDWVLPVGDYLSLWSATKGLSFLDGYRSRYQLGRVPWYGVKRDPYSSYYYPKNPDGSRGTYKYIYEDVVVGSGDAYVEAYTRNPLTTFPLPHFEADLGLSTSNVISALALIRQLK